MGHTSQESRVMSFVRGLSMISENVGCCQRTLKIKTADHAEETHMSNSVAGTGGRLAHSVSLRLVS